VTAGERHAREREGLEMILSGLSDGLAWMPQDAASFAPLLTLKEAMEKKIAIVRLREAAAL
jgi:hypothetical protein